MGKRGNGEGSIYQRKADKKWVASVTLDNGKRKVLYGNTRQEVKNKLHKAMHEQQQGTLVATAQQTIAQYFDMLKRKEDDNGMAGQVCLASPKDSENYTVAD